MASRACLPAGSTIPKEAATALATICSSALAGRDDRSENAACRSWSARKARRVLPTPPGPVRVTKR